MYEIEFYKDSSGHSEIAEFIKELRHRFLYAYFKDNKFIVLHHFIKKTRKTPKKEIEQAKRKLKCYLERSADNDYMENFERRIETHRR